MPMEVNYRDDVKEIVDDVLLSIPGVKGGKSWGYPAYKANSKVFLFVGGDGLSIKLPEARVQELIDTSATMSQFSPVEGTVWKQWVTISHDDADDYREDIALIEESMQFAAG